MRVYFYANEHEPIHVHGFLAGCKSKAEIILVDGHVAEIRISAVKDMRPLSESALADFEALVQSKADDIVRKWVDFFVHGRHIAPEKITRRIS